MTIFLIGISLAIGYIRGTFDEKTAWERELNTVARRLTGRPLPAKHPITQDLIFRLQGQNND